MSHCVKVNFMEVAVSTIIMGTGLGPVLTIIVFQAYRLCLHVAAAGKSCCYVYIHFFSLQDWTLSLNLNTGAKMPALGLG